MPRKQPIAAWQYIYSIVVAIIVSVAAYYLKDLPQLQQVQHKYIIIIIILISFIVVAEVIFLLIKKFLDDGIKRRGNS